MSKKDLIVDLIAHVVGDRTTASMVVEVLQTEGLLVLGYGERDTDAIVIKFSEAFGNTKVSRYDRFAAQRLANKYGSQAVTGIIEILSKHSNEKFAPVVNDVSQLEKKFVSILHFVRNLEVQDEVITTGKE